MLFTYNMLELMLVCRYAFALEFHVTKHDTSFFAIKDQFSNPPYPDMWPQTSSLKIKN